MKKLTKLLIIFAISLFLYSCDNSKFYEPASVSRAGAINTEDTASVAKKKVVHYTNSEAKLVDFKYGTNGFIFILEVPPNPGTEDKYKGDWDTLTTYTIVLVPYASGTAYSNVASHIYGDYETAKKAYDAGKTKL